MQYHLTRTKLLAISVSNVQILKALINLDSNETQGHDDISVLMIKSIN